MVEHIKLVGTFVQRVWRIFFFWSIVPSWVFVLKLPIERANALLKIVERGTQGKNKSDMK